MLGGGGGGGLKTKKDVERGRGLNIVGGGCEAGRGGGRGWIGNRERGGGRRGVELRGGGCEAGKGGGRGGGGGLDARLGGWRMQGTRREILRSNFMFICT